MLLASDALTLEARLMGPAWQERLRLWRQARWGKLEREAALLPLLADPRRAAVDVGGNVGDYAGRLARLCPAVHVFEPNPDLARDLAAKLRFGRVTVHQVALSDREGEAELRVPARGGVEDHGRATVEGGNALDGFETRAVRVRLARLDDALPARERVGFLKVDVEGHELAVLRGATRVLREHRPVLLVESVARHRPGAPGDVIAFLRREGYAGLFLDEAGRPRGLRAFREGVENFVFIPDA